MNNNTVKVLTKNAIKCLVCGEVFVSKSQHHFLSCGYKNQCNKGNIYND